MKKCFFLLTSSNVAMLLGFFFAEVGCYGIRIPIVSCSVVQLINVLFIH